MSVVLLFAKVQKSLLDKICNNTERSDFQKEYAMYFRYVQHILNVDDPKNVIVKEVFQFSVVRSPSKWSVCAGAPPEFMWEVRRGGCDVGWGKTFGGSSDMDRNYIVELFCNACIW